MRQSFLSIPPPPGDSGLTFLLTRVQKWKKCVMWWCRLCKDSLSPPTRLDNETWWPVLHNVLLKKTKWKRTSSAASVLEGALGWAQLLPTTLSLAEMRLKRHSEASRDMSLAASTTLLCITVNCRRKTGRWVRAQFDTALEPLTRVSSAE